MSPRLRPIAFVCSLLLLVAVARVSRATSDRAPSSSPTSSTVTAPKASADAREARDFSQTELLGQRLFEDTNLSEPRGQACASCHDPRQAFAGNDGSAIAAVARGARRELTGGRNVPTAMYLADARAFGFERDQDAKEEAWNAVGGLFWDGRADDLVAQAKGPFLNPREMNNPNADAVVAKVATGPYAALARRVLGVSVFDDAATAFDGFARAIAAYERSATFNPFHSKFDDVLRGTEELSPLEARGFALFKDEKKGNCIACHAGDAKSKNPSDWLFTDFSYDNLGVPRNSAITDNADPTHYDLGLCEQAQLSKHLPKSVAKDDLCGAFRVPTLRNVEKTGPYMHNGALTTLRDVVKFYATRDTNPELWYPGGKSFDDLPARHKKNVNRDEVPMDKKRGETPRLDDSEIDAVVAFMLTLTDR